MIFRRTFSVQKNWGQDLFIFLNIYGHETWQQMAQMSLIKFNFENSRLNFKVLNFAWMTSLPQIQLLSYKTLTTNPKTHNSFFNDLSEKSHFGFSGILFFVVYLSNLKCLFSNLSSVICFDEITNLKYSSNHFTFSIKSLIINFII